MKNLIFLLLLAVTACGQAPKSNRVEHPQKTDVVEVLSFHTKKRCRTCVAIERLTREVVETCYAEQLTDSTLIFKVIDIANDPALAERYEVVWSSLLVNRYKDGKEHTDNLTEFAFATARMNPDKFKAGLKAAIDKQLDR